MTRMFDWLAFLMRPTPDVPNPPVIPALLLITLLAVLVIFLFVLGATND